MQTREVKAAVDALASAFEEFKNANDEALRQKADKGAVDALTGTIGSASCRERV